jgi:hypothetical protein
MPVGDAVTVLGVDPVGDYTYLLETGGFDITTYEETPGWRERVYASFGALIDASEALTTEMGQTAAASALAEAMITVRIKPYPRRIRICATRPD